MARADFFEQYLDPALKYDFTKGPEVVGDLEQARKMGMNCISLAHIVLKDLFDVALRPEQHCYEMYADSIHFESVEKPSAMQVGDLVWFGYPRPRVSPATYKPVYDTLGRLENWRDNPIKHVGIYTGKIIDGDYGLLHATHYTGGNVIWPLKKFKQFRRYNRTYRISRFIADAPRTAERA